MSNTLNWHSVVHGNSDSWAEGVSFNLNDANFASLAHKCLLEFGVTTLDSEDDVDSASPDFLSEFGCIVTIGVVDEVPEHGTSLVCKINISIESSVLIHVCAVKSCNVHWHNSWSIIVGIRRFLMECPVTQNWAIWFSVSEQILSDDHNSTSCSSQVLLSSSINHA